MYNIIRKSIFPCINLIAIAATVNIHACKVIICVHVDGKDVRFSHKWYISSKSRIRLFPITPKNDHP